MSLDPAGRANRTDAAFAPMISADGQSVAIHSRAANLVADDYNASFDVFLATLPTFAPVPGDFDGSGVVDEADYSIVRSHFGSAVPPGTMGDANGDRIVDNADYVIWRKNLGAVVSGSGAALGAAASEDNLLKSAGPVANLVQPPAGSRASVYTTVASNARLPAPNGSSAPLSGRDSYSLDHASRRASIVRDNAARVTLRSSPNVALERAYEQLHLLMTQTRQKWPSKYSANDLLSSKRHASVALEGEAFSMLAVLTRELNWEVLRRSFTVQT